MPHFVPKNKFFDFVHGATAPYFVPFFGITKGRRMKSKKFHFFRMKCGTLVPRMSCSKNKGFDFVHAATAPYFVPLPRGSDFVHGATAPYFVPLPRGSDFVHSSLRSFFLDLLTQFQQRFHFTTTCSLDDLPYIC